MADYSGMTDAGRLRQRVTIEAPQTADDGAGGRSLAWQEEGTVWASVEPLRASNSLRYDQLSQRIYYRIRMRYRQELTPRHRLIWENRLFTIVSVSEEDASCRFSLVEAYEEFI